MARRLSSNEVYKKGDVYHSMTGWEFTFGGNNCKETVGHLMILLATPPAATTGGWVTRDTGCEFDNEEELCSSPDKG